MRLVSAAAAVLLAIVACGDDPTGPETTMIRVRLDWPMVRESEFVDAEWARRDIGRVREAGEFGADGIVYVEYESYCQMKTPPETDWGLEFWVGGFYEGSDTICATTFRVLCTTTLQEIVIERPSYPSCQPGEA
jgi:hypothetical protein